MPLLRTKLYRPSPPGDLIIRSRLIDTLNRGLGRPLTLVVAPAGYGKTILLSSWLDACPLPAVWLSLDENDNDLRLFLAYLAAGLRVEFPESMRRTQLNADSANLPPFGVIAGDLANDLDELGRRVILVLDDLHTIHQQDIYAVLAELLRHPPRAAHLALATRQDPPLPLGSLRGRDQLTEIRAQDLRFSSAESAAFLDQALGAPLESNILAVLMERTEGWAAGLRLAALTLHYGSDVDRHIAVLHAENRYVMDYLVSEVLAQVAPDIEDFLLRTSILDWLSSPLCAAVMGWPEAGQRSQTALEWLEAANLFTVSLDEQRQWYRYHALFRKLLQNRLERRLSPDEIADLHRRASAWFASHESIESALRHALAGNDVAGAAALVAQDRHHLLNTEQRPRLYRMLQQFPAAAMSRYPDLLLAKAWTAESGQADAQTMLDTIRQAQALVDQMDPQSEQTRGLQGEIDTLRSLEKTFAADDPQGIIELTTRALETMPLQWYLARSEAWLHMALAYQMQGQLDHAYAVIATGQREDVVEGDTTRMRVTASLGFVHWLAADLAGLLHSSLRGISHAGNQHETLGWCHYGAATALYQRNDLPGAAHHAGAVFDQRYTCHPMALVQCALVLAAIEEAHGRPDEARLALAQAAAYLEEIRRPGLAPICQAFGVELAARQGDFDAARSWAAVVGPRIPFQTMAFFYAPQVTLPKVLLAIDTPASREQATGALQRLHAFVTATHNARFTIDVLALEALLAAAEGDRPAALLTLEQALALARPGGFIRAFVDLGEPMAGLLRQLARRGSVHGAYIAQLLDAFPPFPAPSSRSQARPPGMVEPLTLRETEILELLAVRLSAKEIAQRLVISDRTVKRHCANIYQKLGVNSRREAVDAAHSLRLLPMQ